MADEAVTTVGQLHAGVRVRWTSTFGGLAGKEYTGTVASVLHAIGKASIRFDYDKSFAHEVDLRLPWYNGETGRLEIIGDGKG